MAKKTNNNNSIQEIYTVLDEYYGDLKWWPAETSFEVMVGAVLTQNTSWGNVEKAIAALKKRNIMSPGKIFKENKLPEIIRPAGFHYLKSKRLKALCRYLINKGGRNFELLKKKTIKRLRRELLEINGIGHETADCIILYALEKPVFVVDSYTKRIMSRHGIIGSKDPYLVVQEEISSNFSIKLRELKQYHAIIVETAKRFCKKNNPLCDKCPLGSLLSKKKESK